MRSPHEEAMQRAFVLGDFAAMKELVMAGGDPNARDKRDDMPILHLAVSHKAYDMIDFLISHKVEIDKRGPRGCTALHVAVESGEIMITRKLLDAGADANTVDAGGSTPFSYGLASILRAGSNELLLLLVERGADKNVKNKGGRLVLDVYREMTGDPFHGL